MAKGKHFHRAEKPTFECNVCGRGARRTTQPIGSELCSQCYDLAGLDNEVNDNSMPLTREIIGVRNELLRRAIEAGGNAAHIMSANQYLWPKQPQVTNATDDGLDIPAFLRRKPGDVDTAPITTAAAPVAAKPRKPFYVPKGMSEEEYDTMNEKLNPQPAANGEAKTTKTAKTKKSSSTPRPSPVEGATTLADLCRKHNIDPRQGRRAARSDKKAFAPLFVAGKKYVIEEKNEKAVLELVRSILDKASAKPVKAKAKAKAANADPKPEPVELPKRESKLIKRKK